MEAFLPGTAGCPETGTGGVVGTAEEVLASADGEVGRAACVERGICFCSLHGCVNDEPVDDVDEADGVCAACFEEIRGVYEAELFDEVLAGVDSGEPRRRYAQSLRRARRFERH